MSALLSQINNTAHQGAFGHNPHSEPTLAQLAAGNYKKGVVMVKGLSIAIENPAYTYRKGMDKSGKEWMCLMQAHYGYIQGHKSNDGDEMDIFIGNVPENDTVYIVNQKTADGYFDEHKIMLGFLSQQQAVDTYQHCFERGWTGLMSVVSCTMTQFKWWLANGDKSRPVTLDRLPYAGLERLDSVIWGGNDGTVIASHSGQVHKLLYQIRQCDDTHQALEPLSYNDLVQELGNQGFMYENYDALVVEYNKLEKKAKQLLMVMQGAASTVKPMGVTVGKPLTKGGVANVVAWFEMDDGQAVGVFFHNPDKTPKKIDPTDEMITYKWVLNKKDITIAVAPEQGKDLIIRTVAKRIMQLVEKNHDRFVKANGDKAALNKSEQDLTTQVAEKQATLKGLQDEVAALQGKKAEKDAFTLQTQTEADLHQREAEAQASEAERLAQEKAAKDKAQADKDAADFRLTGSNLPADVAAAGGQQDLLVSGNQNDKEDAEKEAFVSTSTFERDDVDKNKYRLIGADGREYQVIWKSGSTWAMMTGETFKTLAEAKQAAIDHALDRKEIERQEAESRASATQNNITVGVKRKPVSVYVYWSESSLFKENTTYPFAKFEALANTEAMEHNDGGYAKTKVKVTFDDGFVYGDIRVDLNQQVTGFKSLVANNLDYYKSKNITNEEQELLSTFDFSSAPVKAPVSVPAVSEKTSGERPSKWRTNLADARAVAKSLGIETKGKKLDGLVKEIDIFDTNKMKKQALAELNGLAGRLVLPTGYAIDLKEAEKSIGDVSYFDVSAFINKIGNVDKNDVQYVELRVSPRLLQNAFYGYTFAGNRNNPKVKVAFQRFPQSKEYSTAQDLILDIEKFLIDKIFPEIEYLKVKNSTDIDVVDLPSLGVATITNVGSENINIEKDGKYYISKVGNTEHYALGEWDFAKYPEGNVSVSEPQPVTTPFIGLKTPIQIEAEKGLANLLGANYGSDDQTSLEDMLKYTNWNTNFSDARAVAKKIGISLIGKSLEKLKGEIDKAIAKSEPPQPLSEPAAPTQEDQDREFLQSAIDEKINILDAANVNKLAELSKVYTQGDMNGLIKQAKQVAIDAVKRSVANVTAKMN